MENNKTLPIEFETESLINISFPIPFIYEPNNYNCIVKSLQIPKSLLFDWSNCKRIILYSPHLSNGVLLKNNEGYRNVSYIININEMTIGNYDVTYNNNFLLQASPIYCGNQSMQSFTMDLIWENSIGATTRFEIPSDNKILLELLFKKKY